MKHIALVAAAAVLTSTALAQTNAPSAPKAQPVLVAQADLDSMFQRLDANNDGFISRAEAAAMKDLLAVFDRADANRDGQLDKIEFAAAMSMLK